MVKNVSSVYIFKFHIKRPKSLAVHVKLSLHISQSFT